MKKLFPLTVLLFVVGFAAGQVLSDDKIWVTFADTTTLLSSDKATTNTSINEQQPHVSEHTGAVGVSRYLHSTVHLYGVVFQ
jgi:hypothetical protein